MIVEGSGHVTTTSRVTAQPAVRLAAEAEIVKAVRPSKTVVVTAVAEVQQR